VVKLERIIAPTTWIGKLILLLMTFKELHPTIPKAVKVDLLGRQNLKVVLLHNGEASADLLTLICKF